MSVLNGTSGSYSVTVKCSVGGTGVTVGQGSADKLFCDGTNIYSSTPSVSIESIPPGTMFSYAGSTAPNANYALCDGSAVLAHNLRRCHQHLDHLRLQQRGDDLQPARHARALPRASPDGGTGRLNSWTLGQTGGAWARRSRRRNCGSRAHNY